MIRVAISCMFALLASGFLSITTFAGTRGLEIEADVDGDGKHERIDLDKTRLAILRVFHGRNLMWSGVPWRWKPGKLETVAELAAGWFGRYLESKPDATV